MLNDIAAGVRGVVKGFIPRKTHLLSAEQVAEGWKCRKRDGSLVPFDCKKISKALFRCFHAIETNDGTLAVNNLTTFDTVQLVERLVKSVVNLIEVQQLRDVEVEHVQRLIIQQLWSEGLFAAAEHYQNYREAHRKARLSKPIAPEIAARFSEDQKHFPSDLQYYQFMSKFSRWKEDEQRRETWKETTYERVIPWLQKLPQAAGKLSTQEWQELADSMYNLEVSPAMRVVQMAGPALDRCHVGAYNCFTSDTRFITTSGVKCFKDFNSGDKVSVITHTGLIQNAVVRQYGNGKVNRVTFTKGKIKHTVTVTENHRWLLQKGEVTEKLKVGDRIFTPPSALAAWSYEEAEPDEKLFWAYGLTFGDGTCVKRGSEYKYSMVRLCGLKAQFLDRFVELGFSYSYPPSQEGDPTVYTGTYLKALPNIEQDGLRKVIAFVRGWLDADGAKNTNQNPGSPFSSIQATGDEKVKFIREIFPCVGVYINSEADLTEQVTNYGKRSATTVKFGITQDFGDSVNNSSFVVKDIEPEGKTVPLWCLEVENDHSFILPSGIVTGNCAYAPLNEIFAFPELLYILMQGTGQGFSCENEYISQLPRIKKQTGKKKDTIVVEDSTEGWCNAYHELLLRLWDGHDLDVDVSNIRKKGAVLKTKGGRASGPLPFVELLDFARNLVKKKQGKFFEDIDAHDLACMTGKIVQVGGVRRAAEISLSDLDSVAMRNAKSGNWYDKAKHRTMANNSAVYDFEDTVPVETFMEEWLSLTKSKSGERGIFNRKAALQYRPMRRLAAIFGCNPCAEIILRPLQFCNLSIVIARMWDTVQTLIKKVRLATIFGKLQSLCTNFNYIRPGWKKNCEEERLLGVDITGHADCPLLRVGAPGRAELLRTLQKVVLETDKEYSARFGVNLSAANTTIKPGGDSAVLFDCASGVSPRYAPYYMRWVRETKDSPIAQFLIASGVPHAPAPEAPDNLLVFGFPKKSPEGATCRNDMPAELQFYNWLEWKQNWAEHSVSATIYVEDNEWPALGGLVYNNIDKITGLSFLPKDNGTYTYAPHEELTEEQYNAVVAAFPVLNWAKLPEYEVEDSTEARQTLACVGGGC